MQAEHEEALPLRVQPADQLQQDLLEPQLDGSNRLSQHRLYPARGELRGENGDPIVTCDPASGSTFALGTTTVTCSANDAAGNTGDNTFTVTVADTLAPNLTVSGAKADR